MSLLGMNHVRALGLIDFRGPLPLDWSSSFLSCWLETQAPSILDPPPRAWILGQLRGNARPSHSFICLEMRMSLKLQLADFGGLSASSRYGQKVGV